MSGVSLNNISGRLNSLDSISEKHGGEPAKMSDQSLKEAEKSAVTGLSKLQGEAGNLLDAAATSFKKESLWNRVKAKVVDLRDYVIANPKKSAAVITGIALAAIAGMVFGGVPGIVVGAVVITGLVIGAGFAVKHALAKKEEAKRLEEEAKTNEENIPPAPSEEDYQAYLREESYIPPAPPEEGDDIPLAPSEEGDDIPPAPSEEDYQAHLREENYIPPPPPGTPPSDNEKPPSPATNNEG